MLKLPQEILAEERGQKGGAMAALVTMFTLDERRVYTILNYRQDGVLCRKRSISAIVQNNTGITVQYSTVMQDGRREVREGEIPPGFFAAVQANGEIGVLRDPQGAPTQTILYDMENPLAFKDVLRMAAEENFTFTLPEMVENVTFTSGGKITGMPVIYAASKGQVLPFRFTFQGMLPKLAWGPNAVQTTEFDCAMVVNVLTKEAYLIGRAELVGNWYVENAPQLTKEEFWNSLPEISAAEFDAMRTLT